MRIQADRCTVVIDSCMTDSNLGHGVVGLMKDIQSITLCASKRDDAVSVRTYETKNMCFFYNRSAVRMLVA
jgi:hypothetical protein